MNDYRLVIVSTEPMSDYWFVEYVEAINEHEAVTETNQRYAPHFEVERDTVTEIMR